MKDPITTKKQVVPMGDGRILYRYTFENDDADQGTERPGPSGPDPVRDDSTGNLGEKAESSE